jgi:hypothetical protein
MKNELHLQKKLLKEKMETTTTTTTTQQKNQDNERGRSHREGDSRFNSSRGREWQQHEKSDSNRGGGFNSRDRFDSNRGGGFNSREKSDSNRDGPRRGHGSGSHRTTRTEARPTQPRHDIKSYHEERKKAENATNARWDKEMPTNDRELSPEKFPSTVYRKLDARK